MGKKKKTQFKKYILLLTTNNTLCFVVERARTPSLWWNLAKSSLPAAACILLKQKKNLSDENISGRRRPTYNYNRGFLKPYGTESHPSNRCLLQLILKIFPFCEVTTSCNLVLSKFLYVMCSF